MPSRIELTRHASPGLVVAAAICWIALTALLGAGFGITLWSLITSAMAGILALWFIWREALLRSPKAIIRLQVHHDQLLVFRPGESGFAVAVADSSRLFASMALLNLRPVDTKISPESRNTRCPSQVLLLDLPFCHNVDAEEFRRLRVWVRFHSTARKIH